ncbi:hypothetical protein MMC28_010307 [Mycoblastus sanguinarius]|nr:hypothetical protein [Mycoblastus sanguinarius]
MENEKSQPSKFPSQAIGLADSPTLQGDTSISASFKVCLSLFDNLVSRLKEWSILFVPGLAPSLWEDELGRLKIWAGNIGAHLHGQASLDFRLRDASHIRQNVTELLEDLCQTIRDVDNVLKDPEAPGHDVAPESLISNEEPENELEQLHREVVTILGCLFQMSILVRNPAHHSLLTETQPTDISAFEPFDRNHVREKYPKAQEALVQRLGIALTRRRKHLKYRERHHTKLSRDLGGGQTGRLAYDNLSVLSDTIATDFRMAELSIEDNSTRSETSETSFASTLLSGENITIPKPPKDSIEGAPFECPYCYYIIIAKNTRSWIKHVFLDLQPYSCTVIDCSIPHKLYSTQHEWSRHLNSAHGKAWHGSGIATTTMGVGGKKLEVRACCPLCKSEFDSEKQLEHDLARHLQELALFVLPKEENDSNDEGTEDGLGFVFIDESSSSDDSDGQSEVDKDINVLRSGEDQVGRVDALGPPSQQHPVPAPPP